MPADVGYHLGKATEAITDLFTTISKPNIGGQDVNNELQKAAYCVYGWNPACRVVKTKKGLKAGTFLKTKKSWTVKQ